MFKIILLLIVLLLQLLPSYIIDYLEDDAQWQLWHMSMLTIVLVQALIIYKDLEFKKIVPKVLTLATLVVSLWFLFDYTRDTAIEEGQEVHIFYSE